MCVYFGRRSVNYLASQKWKYQPIGSTMNVGRIFRKIKFKSFRFKSVRVRNFCFCFVSFCIGSTISSHQRHAAPSVIGVVVVVFFSLANLDCSFVRWNSSTRYVSNDKPETTKGNECVCEAQFSHKVLLFYRIIGGGGSRWFWVRFKTWYLKRKTTIRDKIFGDSLLLVAK